MNTSQLKPQDRIFRWWDAGIEMVPQALTVIRNNTKTVTVITDQGSQFRLPHNDVAGYWTE